MPAMPPPTTSAALFTGTVSSCKRHQAAPRGPPPCGPGRRPSRWPVRAGPSGPTSTGRGCWPSPADTGFRPASRSVSRKIGSWVRGVHEATTTRFSRCSAICSLMWFWRVVGAGVGVALGDDDVGQFAGPLDDPLDVDHRGDVAAAMADEHADPRRLVGDVALRRIGLGAHAGAAGRGQAGPWPGPPPRWPASPCRECPSAPGTRRPRRRPAATCPAGTARWSGRIPSGSARRPCRSACSCSVALGSRPSESTIMSNSSSICFISALA